MAEPSPQALAIPVDAADDLLYDAVAIAFVYAAWAVADMWLGERVGLLVLVLATSVLTLTALAGRSHASTVSGARSFLVEFATIILYCATTLAGSILVIDVLT